MQDQLYHQAIAAHGEEVSRYLTGYESNSAKRQELLQEVHLALWQSFSGFNGECSLRTWIYRIANNVAVTYLRRKKRKTERAELSLDEAELHLEEEGFLSNADNQLDLRRVMLLIHSLAQMDRQIILLYLEDLDAASISAVTGLSASNVATKIHRIKKLLAALVNGGCE